jgi:hypothetical protein
MPYTSTISPDACRKHLAESVSDCYSATAAGGVFHRSWPADPAEVAAAAAFHASAFRDLLCIGCARLFDRLVAEGKLP